MPSTKVLFVVPEDITALGAILCDHGGTLEFEDQFETYDDAAVYLSEYVGRVISADFEDVDDTLEPLFAFVDELDKHKAAYLGVADAFEERSRSIRYDGTVVYNLFEGSTERAQMNYPWSEGDPETDERTLRIAGVPEDKMTEIVGKLMPPVMKSDAVPVAKGM